MSYKYSIIAAILIIVGASIYWYEEHKNEAPIYEKHTIVKQQK